MRVDSRTRKIVKQQEHRPNLQNPWQEWHQHFSTLLEKLTTWRQYSGSWVGKQTVFRSAGGNERWLNDESVYWRQWCSKKDNQWTSTFRSYWGQCCSKIVHDLVNPVNNRESKDTLEGNLLKHGYDSWQMLSGECIWMNIERCTPPRLTVGPSILNLKSALHRMNMGDEQHWWCQRISFHDLIWQAERNPWRRTLSLQRWAFVRQAMRCMSGRLDNFHEDWW